MTKKFDVVKWSIVEFEEWVNSFQLTRTILVIQQHHTFSTSYAYFLGENKVIDCSTYFYPVNVEVGLIEYALHTRASSTCLSKLEKYHPQFSNFNKI